MRRFASWCIHRGWGWWWSWDLSWIATTHLGALQLQSTIPWAQPLFEAYIAGAWILYWTDDTLYWVAKPTIHIEGPADRRRLHNDTGPAVESDAENLYFVHGVLVPEFVVVRPDWITTTHITQEPNAEVRRIMLERYGTARYIKDIGATAIDRCDDATLYQVALAGDEPLTMVEVVNDTPEPDGSFRRFMLRVDPQLRPLLGTDASGQPILGKPQAMTAWNAIASTFGLCGSQYRPTIET